MKNGEDVKEMMGKKLPNEQPKVNIEGILEAGESVQIKPQGYSMYPLFVPGRDWAVISPPENKAKLKKGDVVNIPPDVKHWHGAAKDSWFQHLTYMTKVEEGSTTEWLEPVGDAAYGSLAVAKE